MLVKWNRYFQLIFGWFSFVSNLRVLQLRSEKLVECQETVTLCYSKEQNLFVCGSYHYLMLYDPRTMGLVQCCGLRDKETGSVLNTCFSFFVPQLITLCSYSGIRSLASVDKVLTVGTGKGLIRFYDLSAGKFISCNCGLGWSLTAGSGRIVRLPLHYRLY